MSNTKHMPAATNHDLLNRQIAQDKSRGIPQECNGPHGLDENNCVYLYGRLYDLSNPDDDAALNRELKCLSDIDDPEF